MAKTKRDKPSDATIALKEAEKAYAGAQIALEEAAKRLEVVASAPPMIQTLRITRAENGGWIVDDTTGLHEGYAFSTAIGSFSSKFDLLAFLSDRLE